MTARLHQLPIDILDGLPSPQIKISSWTQLDQRIRELQRLGNHPVFTAAQQDFWRLTCARLHEIGQLSRSVVGRLESDVSAKRVVTHGDLKWNNVVYGDDGVWLIDVGSAAVKPYLKDFSQIAMSGNHLWTHVGGLADQTYWIACPVSRGHYEAVVQGYRDGGGSPLPEWNDAVRYSVPKRLEWITDDLVEIARKAAHMDLMWIPQELQHLDGGLHIPAVDASRLALCMEAIWIMEHHLDPRVAVIEDDGLPPEMQRSHRRSHPPDSELPPFDPAKATLALDRYEAKVLSHSLGVDARS